MISSETADSGELGTRRMSSYSTREIISQPLQGPSEAMVDDRTTLRCQNYTSNGDAPAGDVLQKIKDGMQKNKFYHISANEMRTLLKGFGAEDEDFKAFGEVYSDPAKALDPANPHKYANTRNNFFVKESNAAPIEDVYASRQILPLVPVRIDVDEAFNARNGGLNYRPYRPVADWMLFNSVYNAILKFIMSIVDSEAPPHPGMADTNQFFVGTDFVQATVSNVAGRRHGMVAPEGIHQDGCEVAMVMLHGRHNLKEGGAESRLFDVKCESGPYGIAGGRKISQEESDKEEAEREKYLLGKFTMTSPFEAVIFFDQEVKHEVRGKLSQADDSEEGLRETLLVFARRPLNDGWEKEDEGVAYEEAKRVYEKEKSLNGLFAEAIAEFDAYVKLYENKAKVPRGA